jgi:hypothetical protein
MRKWASAAVVLTVLCAPAAASADSHTPAAVYSDFAEDGVLSCGHSRSALKHVLSDATLHQYGDPLTLIGLKLAVREQLAAGCRRKKRALAVFAPGGSVGSAGSTEQDARGETSRRNAKENRRSGERPVANARPEAAGTAPVDVRQDGRMVLLGIVLLLVTLASGGWAARRALDDEP